MTPDIEKLIAEVRRLDKAATPGPWFHNGYDNAPARAVWNYDGDDDEMPPGFQGKLILQSTETFQCHPPEPERSSNVELAATFRTAAPALADALEKCINWIAAQPCPCCENGCTVCGHTRRHPDATAMLARIGVTIEQAREVLGIPKEPPHD